jgi:4-amino-4-deoxy-L-arabinose transferase-like glycosyltransferase
VSARPSNKPAPKPRAAGRTAQAQSRARARARRWTERLRPWHAAVLLALLHLLLALLSLDPTPHNGGDNAAYLALARSLLERGTYQELWEPAMRAHTQYPPGWPMILAAAMTLGVKPWIGFKVISTLFSAAAVGLSYLWARRVASPGVGLAVAAVLAMSPGVVDLARWELSDVPFWCFTMLALWAFARMSRAPHAGVEPAPADAGRDALGALALASLAVLLAYGTRSAGVPLMVAAGGWLAWRRRWRSLAVYVGIVGPFAAAWWVRGRMVGGTSYTGNLWNVDPYTPSLGRVTFGGMLERIARNGVEYTGDHLPYLLIGQRMTAMAVAAGVLVAVLSAVGWGMRLRRAGLAEVWLPLYLGLVLIWPAEWSGERFLLPALPVLLVCAAEVVRVAGRRVGEPVVLGAGLVLILAAAGARRTVGEIQLAASCRAAYGPEYPHPCLPEPWQDFLNIAASTRGRLPANAAVLSRKPTLFWAESGYPSRVYPFTTSPDSLLMAARDAGAAYVLMDYLDNISMMYLAPVLMQRPQAFCVMEGAGAGRATLMGIVPGAERMPNVRAAPTGVENVTMPFAYCPTALKGARTGQAP